MADQDDLLFHPVEDACQLVDIVGEGHVGRRSLVLAEARQVGAQTLCPAASSIGTTFSQHQPPVQAPWISRNVATP